MSLLFLFVHPYVYPYLCNDKLPNTLKPLRSSYNGIKTSNFNLVWPIKCFTGMKHIFSIAKLCMQLFV